MNEYQQITDRADQLMENAIVGAQSLLGHGGEQGLLAEALVNAIAALTLEVRGLRLTQEALVDYADRARNNRF